jgi:hypothetical protein
MPSTCSSAGAGRSVGGLLPPQRAESLKRAFRDFGHSPPAAIRAREKGDMTMKKVLVLAAFAFFAFALAAGPEVAMTVHPVPVVACSGNDC